MVMCRDIASYSQYGDHIHLQIHRDGLRQKLKLRHFIYLNMIFFKMLFKFYYLILDAKLLLININHVDFFLKAYRQKI